MKDIRVKLDIHTPWHRHVYKIDDAISYEELIKLQNEQEYYFYKYNCGDLCEININNQGEIFINFYNEMSESDVRHLLAIIIYFISICNGYNCKYEKNMVIDGKEKCDFMSFAKEDDCPVPLFKDTKFYEICLEDIDSKFGDIIYELYSKDKLYILELLNNYYSSVVYKDFNGNNYFHFRNLVTNIESITSSIYEEEYKKIENNNKNYIKDLLVKVNNLCDLNLKRSDINKHVMIRRPSLDNKIKDFIDCCEHEFGLKFKKDKIIIQKVADTRNFISHIFDNTEKVYLTNEEISDFNVSFWHLFRMVFLVHVCKINNVFVRQQFLRNSMIRMQISKEFDVL